MEGYVFVLRSRIGKIYFASDGLSEVEMFGEVMYSIEPSVQLMARIVGAMFSPEVIPKFNRVQLIRDCGTFIEKVVRRWISNSSACIMDNFFEELTLAAHCPNDFDPGAENALSNLVQLLYVYAQMCSIAFRRLPLVSVSANMKQAVNEIKSVMSTLLNEVSSKMAEGRIKEKLKMGLYDFVNHVSMIK